MCYLDIAATKRLISLKCFVCFPNIFSISTETVVSTQLAHNVVRTLSFGCILVATLDNVVTTLSQRCVSEVVATTKN